FLIAHLSSFFFLPALLSTAAAPSAVYPLSLHDALPISVASGPPADCDRPPVRRDRCLQRWSADSAPGSGRAAAPAPRVQSGPAPESEEHTSELQSRENLVCRLLLEKKKEYTNARQASSS